MMTPLGELRASTNSQRRFFLFASERVDVVPVGPFSSLE